MRKRDEKQHKKNKLHLALLLMAALVLCCGCVRQAGVLRLDVTLPPEATPSPTPSPTPEPTLTMEPIATATPEPVNYWQYLSFRDLYVYEESGDTFLHGIVESEYPGSLIAVLDVFFYDDDGEKIARGRIMNGAGEDVLILEPGETRIYAQVDTDMSITMLDFGFETVGDALTALD